MNYAHRTDLATLGSQAILLSYRLQDGKYEEALHLADTLMATIMKMEEDVRENSTSFRTPSHV